MYVVQIVKLNNEGVDYKVFSLRSDAQKRYDGARLLFYREDVESAALFLVQTDNAREAVNLVKKGDMGMVSLIDAEPKPLPDLDLDDLLPFISSAP